MEYFVIIYDSSCGETKEVLAFGKNHEAAFEYFQSKEIEYLTTGQHHMTANYVSAKDEKAMRESFGRFFRNIQTDWNWPAKMHGCIHD